MFQEHKGSYEPGDEWIAVREMLIAAFRCAYRASRPAESEEEYVLSCLQLIASMQVEPESIYCEEGMELTDTSKMDHMDDVLRTDGAWVYYGVEAENFFLITHMESREAAAAKVAELAAEGDSVCCVVDLTVQ